MPFGPRVRVSCVALTANVSRSSLSLVVLLYSTVRLLRSILSIRTLELTSLSLSTLLTTGRPALPGTDYLYEQVSDLVTRMLVKVPSH